MLQTVLVFFENNELIQAQTWDDAIVDKALAHFKGRACQDQFVVTSIRVVSSKKVRFLQTLKVL